MSFRKIRPTLTVHEANMIVTALHERTMHFADLAKSAKEAGDSGAEVYADIIMLEFDKLRAKIEKSI